MKDTPEEARTPENEEKPKTKLNRKEAFHNALRGMELGISVGSVLGAAIAFGLGASILPTVTLVASFAVIGAAVAIEGNPITFVKECCKKGLNGVKKLIHGHEPDLTQEVQQETPTVPAEKRTITFDNTEMQTPSVSFQQKLMEQSRGGHAHGKGI